MSKTKFCRRSFRPTVKTCLKNDWIDCCSSSATSLNWTYSMLCSGKSLYQYLAPGCDIQRDRKSTRLNSSHGSISYAVFCLKKKTNKKNTISNRRIKNVPADTSISAEWRD